MAKPFYSLQEVCDTLKKSENDVRALVRDGKLREFRDAGKVFFKAEDVDKLRGGAGGGAAAAKKSDTASDIMLEPLDELPPSINDPGASDSITLAPIEDDDKAKKKKEGTVITASGISVFDDDELEIDSDPGAKTRIATAAVGDEVSIEAGSGSGSGLLDLTREADDTSLGAELLDEIYPGEDETHQAKGKTRVAAAEEEEAEPAAEAEESAEAAEEPAGEVLMPVYETAYDPSESIFGGLLVGALIVLGVGASIVGGVLQGFVPSYGQMLSQNFLFVLIGAVVVAGLSTLVGWLVGRASAPRRG